MNRRPAFRFLAAFLLATAACGCRTFPDPAAEKLVRTYNEKLIEAYRTSDEQLMEGLVSEEEARKLLGLIGVKKDMGLTLDSALEEFRLLRIERPAKDRVDVLTEERWHYRDRQIGTGVVVGQESSDHYFMRYVLAGQGRTWVVDRVAFEKPPLVGREQAPNQAPSKVFHGMAPTGSPGSAASRSTGRNP